MPAATISSLPWSFWSTSASTGDAMKPCWVRFCTPWRESRNGRSGFPDQRGFAGRVAGDRAGAKGPAARVQRQAVSADGPAAQLAAVGAVGVDDSVGGGDDQ